MSDVDGWGSGALQLRLGRAKASVAWTHSLLIERQGYRNDAILDAVAAGWTYRRIAEAAGVTIAWISQLVGQRRKLAE